MKKRTEWDNVRGRHEYEIAGTPDNRRSATPTLPGTLILVTMERISAIFVLCVLATPAPGADDSLSKARGLLLGGKYAEAAAIYAPLAMERPDAALGLARCLEAEGKADGAVETLTAVADDQAAVHAELARLAFERGDYEESLARCRNALKLDADQLLARWIRGELHRTAGQLDEAEEIYAELISYHNTHEFKKAESLRWIGLAVARYAAWNRMSGQFNTLVNDLYPAALELEADYWPAHYETGCLLLEKFNQADAAKELQAALELNPDAAEVHVAMARLAVAGRDFDQAVASVDRALQINPGLLAAWLAKADLAWSNFDTRATLDLLTKKALPLNRLSEETAGRMAACYLLLDAKSKPGQATRLTRLIGEVTGRNAHAGEFFSTLAAALETRHKHAEAIRFFRRAIGVMPRQVGPHSHLGLLAMRTGQESEAKRWLDEAFEIDPFNTRVFNTLGVLEVLDSMQTIETDHVIVKYDARRDGLLGRYAAKHLDVIYPELCRQFGYRPPEKPLLEIFNEANGHDGHKWFSTRMIGLPYLGTVAASTGHIVGVASPNESRAARQFNWARVLKHEFVHVVTLQQTNFNVPHWYTEGLAVYSEGTRRPQVWNELLLERVPRGELFDLRTINFGFTRPHDSNEWQMAYCQAELYVEFMLSLWGPTQQRKLLAAFADGLETDEAIRSVFHVSAKQFEQKYIEYLEELVAGMSQLKHPSGGSIAGLLQAHRERPNDADAAAELAYAYVLREMNQEALETARAALKLKAKHQLASYVIARLWLAEDRTGEAIELLEACIDDESPQPNALNLLAGLRLKAEQYDEAARLYALGERLDAVNLKWSKSLARVYLLAENQQKLAEVLARLAEADADDLTGRKKLAEMAMKRRDYAAAANWANQAIQINVMDADMHRIFAEALVNRHNYHRAIEEFEVAIELDPEEPFLRYALADAYIQAKLPADAQRVLEELLAIDPDYPGARLMLKSLTEDFP